MNILASAQCINCINHINDTCIQGIISGYNIYITVLSCSSKLNHVDHMYTNLGWVNSLLLLLHISMYVGELV